MSQALPCAEGVLRSGAAAAPCKPGSERWLLAATILGSSMAFIDGTIVNVILPALQEAFHADVVAVQWVVESYAFLLAALLLVGGAAGDRFGRRRIFLIGVVLFGAASLACGLSMTIAQLVAARAVQGVGAALLVPGSLAIISASFEEKRRGKAIGTWSGYTAITGALGPVAGGFLVQQLSWRYAFLVNIPMAALVVWLTLRHVPESRDPEAPPGLDWIGALLASFGLGALVYGLIELPLRGWRDAQVLGATLGGVAALAVFIRYEKRHPAPMLPLGLFRSLDFTGANLLTLFLYGALGGSLFFFPLNLIQVQGYSVTAAGAALLPFTIVMFLFSRFTGGLSDRFGARLPLVIGPAIAAGGFALFAVPGIGGSYWTTFFPAVLVLGIGMTIAVAPLTTTVMNAVQASQAGAASGINNAVSRAAALLAIAVLGIAMQAGFNRQLTDEMAKREVAGGTRAEVEQQRSRLAAIALPESLPKAERAKAEAAVKSAFVTGFRWVMWLSAALALLSALSAWLTIGKQKRNS
ncbi:MFS transporter [Massilia endophytica]|uniref:MFS transporter n=1 Tax=Massilia endophytica TaxID=2899220 RepID=UPI001E342874|nr:MFS transporter [Massilia endophytica]UGQ49037.1 MFS transporter [Massilia endophytica]